MYSVLNSTSAHLHKESENMQKDYDLSPGSERQNAVHSRQKRHIKVVRDLAGTVLSDQHVGHRYTIELGLIQIMEICPPPLSDH